MLRRITLDFWECSVLEKRVPAGAKHALRLLRSIGGEFVRVNPDCSPEHFVEETDPEPESNIETSGNALGCILGSVTLSHPLLRRDIFPYDRFREFAPVADLSFLDESRSLFLRQMGPDYEAAEDANPKRLDDLANGLLALGRLAYPAFQPAYGFSDEGAYDVVNGNAVGRAELKYVFWANFFGSRYVKKYGRKFLLNAPGWKIEELDGGILYIVRESFSDWCINKPPEVLEYFRQQVPRVRLYRAVHKYY